MHIYHITPPREAPEAPAGPDPGAVLEDVLLSRRVRRYAMLTIAATITMTITITVTIAMITTMTITVTITMTIIMTITLTITTV